MILFAQYEDEGGDAARKALLDAAPKFKGKVMLTETDLDSDVG